MTDRRCCEDANACSTQSRLGKTFQKRYFLKSISLKFDWHEIINWRTLWSSNNCFCCYFANERERARECVFWFPGRSEENTKQFRTEQRAMSLHYFYKTNSQPTSWQQPPTHSSGSHDDGGNLNSLNFDPHPLRLGHNSALVNSAPRYLASGPSSGTPKWWTLTQTLFLLS